MKLRAPVRKAPGSSPGNGGALKPCQPRQASVPGRDFPCPPGNGMLPNFWAARGTECCPFFLQLHPGRSPVSNRAIPGMPSEHREQLRAGAAARPHVEVLHAEVRVELGDGVAEARAAQELGGREGLPVVQHDALARLPHRHEAPLGHPPTGPHEPEPRPEPAAGSSRRDPAPGAPAAPPPLERAAGSRGR